MTEKKVKVKQDNIIFDKREYFVNDFLIKKIYKLISKNIRKLLTACSFNNKPSLNYTEEEKKAIFEKSYYEKNIMRFQYDNLKFDIDFILYQNISSELENFINELEKLLLDYCENDKQIIRVDKELLKSLIEKVKNNKAYELIPPKQENGVTVSGYFSYCEEICRFYNILNVVPTYYKEVTSKVIYNADYSTMSLNELCIYYSIVHRMERLSDGLIVSCIQSGAYLKMLERLLEFCEIYNM